MPVANLIFCFEVQAKQFSSVLSVIVSELQTADRCRVWFSFNTIQNHLFSEFLNHRTEGGFLFSMRCSLGREMNVFIVPLHSLQPQEILVLCNKLKFHCFKKVCGHQDLFLRDCVWYEHFYLKKCDFELIHTIFFGYCILEGDGGNTSAILGTEWNYSRSYCYFFGQYTLPFHATYVASLPS